MTKWEKDLDEIVRVISKKDLKNTFNNSLTLSNNEFALFLMGEKIIESITGDTVKFGRLFGNRSLSKADTIVLIDTSAKQGEWDFSGFLDGQKVRSSGSIHISIDNPNLFFHSYLNAKSFGHDVVLFTQELVSFAENNIIANVLEREIHNYSIDEIKHETEIQSIIQDTLEKEIRSYLLSYEITLISLDSRWSFGSRRSSHSTSSFSSIIHDVAIMNSTNLQCNKIGLVDELDLSRSSPKTISGEMCDVIPEHIGEQIKTRGILTSIIENLKEQKKPDRINFTLTSPSVMGPGNYYEIGVWACLKEQEHEMVEAARELHGADNISKKSKKSVPVKRKTTITVLLDIPDFEIDSPRDTIYWNGDIANCTFMVTVPEDLAFGKYRGKLLFFVEGLQIAKLDFRLNVGIEDKSALSIPINQSMINSAFISYASKDKDIVLARLQLLDTICPNLDIFMDFFSIRSGEDWYERLIDEIEKRDIFYLFWSEAASKSEWVEKEWRAARDLKGNDFICPVPLVSPEKVPPPKELSNLHFNNWMLAYMNDN